MLISSLPNTSICIQVLSHLSNHSSATNCLNDCPGAEVRGYFPPSWPAWPCKLSDSKSCYYPKQTNKYYFPQCRTVFVKTSTWTSQSKKILVVQLGAWQGTQLRLAPCQLIAISHGKFFKLYMNTKRNLANEKGNLMGILVLLMQLVEGATVSLLSLMNKCKMSLVPSPKESQERNVRRKEVHWEEKRHLWKMCPNRYPPFLGKEKKKNPRPL